MCLNQSCQDTILQHCYKNHQWVKQQCHCDGDHLSDLEHSYLHVICGTIYIVYNSKSNETKILVVCQNTNENNCQLHLFEPHIANDSHFMAPCRTCICVATLIRSLLNVCLSVLLFEILNSNIFGLNQLILVVTLSRYQQDKISEYKIWLTICSKMHKIFFLCFIIIK